MSKLIMWTLKTLQSSMLRNVASANKQTREGKKRSTHCLEHAVVTSLAMSESISVF